MGIFEMLYDGTSRDLVDLLLDDFKRSMEYLTENPPAKPMGETHGGSNNHAGRPAVSK